MAMQTARDSCSAVYGNAGNVKRRRKTGTGDDLDDQ